MSDDSVLSKVRPSAVGSQLRSREDADLGRADSELLGFASSKPCLFWRPLGVLIKNVG